MRVVSFHQKLKAEMVFDFGVAAGGHRKELKGSRQVADEKGANLFGMGLGFREREA